MGRGMTIAVLSAAVVGSMGGGLTALHLSRTSRRIDPAVSSIAGSDHSVPLRSPDANAVSSVAPTPTPTQPPPSPQDPHAALVTQIKTMLIAIVDWLHNHPAAQCPDGATLGLSAIDPWGRPLSITCTDQPAD